MLAIIDTHDLEMEHIETYDVSIERPQPPARQTRPGFWRTLVHGITTYLTLTRHERHAPLCHVSRPFETPMDRLIRERPFLAISALSMI
jgi:hypothetical protein